MFTLTRRILVLAAMAAVVAGAAEKKAIWPKGSKPAGPYTPGILIDGTIYVSGQVGRDPKTGNIPENFEAEVQQTLDNINVILKEAGYAPADAISVQVHLTDIELFQRMNAVYMKFFPEPRPTRTTVGVSKLVCTARIEITVTAKK